MIQMMMMKMLMTKVKMKNVVEVSIEFVAVVDYSIMILMEMKGEIYCSYQKENVVDQ